MEESVEAALERAQKDTTNSVVALNRSAPKEAKLAAGAGKRVFPFGVKDIIYTRGLRTTMASKLYQEFVPSFDAPVVSALKAAGGVVAFKTNTHELASGATNTSSIFGPTRNPHDPSRITGGSSGGSAAAVAARIVGLALGTDTAGSVRIPASLCGVYGFKPTNGRLSLKGVLPLSPTLDTVGFLVSDPQRFSVVLQVFSRLGAGPALKEKPRLGVPSWVYWSQQAPEEYVSLVERCVGEFERCLDRLGYEWVRVEMPVAEKTVWRLFPNIRLAEASHVHLDKRERWSECFPDVRRLLEKGLTVSATDYIEALRARREVYLELKRTLRKVDLLATPTTSIPAPKIEEVSGREDGPIRNLLTHNTVYASYIGLPAISVPKMSVDGLPVGLQIMGDRGWDRALVDFARRLV